MEPMDASVALPVAQLSGLIRVESLTARNGLLVEQQSSSQKNKYETYYRMVIGVRTTTINVPNVCREDNHDDECSSSTRISY